MKKLLLIILIMGCDNSTEPTDCFGIANGLAIIDDCGSCVGGTTNLSLNFLKDDCGVCNGGNSTCADCAGTPNGTAVVDGCGVCGGNGTSCTYSVSDLEGVWSGDITVIGAPNSGIITWIITFDDQGNCIESLGTTSVEGNLAVSENGEMTGSITAKYDTEYGEQTDNINFEGSMFISKTQINLGISDCNWSNTSGNSGLYSFTGSLDKSIEYISSENLILVK